MKLFRCGTLKLREKIMKTLNDKLESLQNELESKQNELSEAEGVLQDMKDDPSSYFEDEMKTDYDNMLDEIYEDQFDNFPFPLGMPSTWIEENQPTDYRVGFADHEFDPSHCSDYIDQESLIEQLENEISGIEDEIEELEQEIEEYEDEN